MKELTKIEPLNEENHSTYKAIIDESDIDNLEIDFITSENETEPVEVLGVINKKSLKLHFESTKHHMVLLVSTLVFIVAFTREWVIFSNPIFSILLGLIKGIQPVGIIINVVFAIPIVFSAIAIIFNVIDKKPRLFSITAGIFAMLYCTATVILAYGSNIYAQDVLMQFREEVSSIGNNSFTDLILSIYDPLVKFATSSLAFKFTIPFFISVIAALTILITAIIMPRCPKKESKTYFVVDKQIAENMNNAIVRILNVVLLFLIIGTSFIGLSKEITKEMDTEINEESSGIISSSQDLLDLLNSSVAIVGDSNYDGNQFIEEIYPVIEKILSAINTVLSLISSLFLIVNSVLKIFPVICIIAYLIKTRSAKGEIPLNKGTTFYMLIISALIIAFTKTYPEFFSMNILTYFIAFICVGLIAISFFVGDTFKATVKKTKEIAIIAKDKAVAATVATKEKTIETAIVAKKFADKTSKDLKQTMVQTTATTSEATNKIISYTKDKITESTDLRKQQITKITDDIKQVVLENSTQDLAKIAAANAKNKMLDFASYAKSKAAKKSFTNTEKVVHEDNTLQDRQKNNDTDVS